MKKRRFLKKEYYHAVESLRAKEKFVGERLRKVQLMHERAMTAMTKDRDELRARVRELERQQPSLEFPPEGFTPEVACRDEIMDRRFMGIIPYVRFVGKRAEDGAFPYDGADRYRFRLEIDRRFPLEVNQIAMLKECFLSLLDYVYNQMNNPTGKTRMRL